MEAVKAKLVSDSDCQHVGSFTQNICSFVCDGTTLQAVKRLYCELQNQLMTRLQDYLRVNRRCHMTNSVTGYQDRPEMTDNEVLQKFSMALMYWSTEILNNGPDRT